MKRSIFFISSLLLFISLVALPCGGEKYGYEGIYSGSVSFETLGEKSLKLSIKEIMPAKLRGSIELEGEDVQNGASGTGTDTEFEFEVTVPIEGHEPQLWRLNGTPVIENGVVIEISGKMRYSYCDETGDQCHVVYGNFEVTRD